MSIVRLQSDTERKQGLFYEYDSSDTPLGEGGMGVVYKGYCCDIARGNRRDVAIKALYSDLPPHVIARARREASVRLKNDSLIEMLGFVEIPDFDVIGQPVMRYYVVSEYLNGVTVESLLLGKLTDSYGNIIPFAQELYGKFRNDPYRFALLVIRSLLSGLIALHDAGYIHRDIDPSNIMITAKGQVKLIDYGIVKRLNGHHTKESYYTIAGQFLGKPKYAAPELVRGLVDSQDARTDLYSVGILLYQLITGKVPFDGELVDVLDKQLNENMPTHNLKQRQVRKVVWKATRKSMSARYQSAAEFRVAVDNLVPLQYPERVNMVSFMGIGAIATAIIVSLVLFHNHSTDVPDSFIDTVSDTEPQQSSIPAIEQGYRTISYNRAVELLRDISTTRSGFAMLEQLAGNNDPQALFLLSRLYFKSGEESDNVNNADSLQVIRQWIGIKIDNKLAHNLLVKSVSLDTSNYRAQFELGCDYKSNRRGTTRQPDSAYIYLSTALINAGNANDHEYQNRIKERMANLKAPNATIKVK